MPKLAFRPHPIICPLGAEIDAEPGTSVLDAALAHGIALEHACEKSCACSTCHIVVRQGFSSLEAASEDEEDMLDKAWGLEATSRLACQALISEDNLEIEIPRYTINQVSEQH